MTDHSALDALVDGIRERDDAAFADLHRLLANDLYSFACSLVRDRRFAEDAVQQAFLELVRAAPTLRGDGRSMRSWLFRSVRFTCLDEIRRQGRRPEYPTETMPDTPDPGAETPDLGLDPSLERAWGDLDDRERALLFLKHVVGLSGAEVAASLRMSRPAAYAATRRAERHLESLLGNVESDGRSASSPLRGNEDSE